MSSQEIGYLIGIIVTVILLISLIWGFVWQVKIRSSEKRSNFEALHQVHGFKRYYHVFLFYLLIFALTTDVLGFILLVSFLVTS